MYSVSLLPLITCVLSQQYRAQDRYQTDIQEYNPDTYQTDSYTVQNQNTYQRPSYPAQKPYPAQTYQQPEPYQTQPEKYRQPYKEEEEVDPKPFAYQYSGVDEQGLGSSKIENQGEDGVVTGEYRVELPDGRTQIVSYTADHVNGYQAEVRYEGEARPQEPQDYRDGEDSDSLLHCRPREWIPSGSKIRG